MTRRAQSGFTLVEVLVALMVFVIGILSIAAMMPSGSRSVNRSGDETRASELASARAERLLSTSYADPDLTAGSRRKILRELVRAERPADGSVQESHRGRALADGALRPGRERRHRGSEIGRLT